jgi:parallel beta-helix repeat protein
MEPMKRFALLSCLLLSHVAAAQFVLLTPPSNQTQTVSQTIYFPLRVNYASFKVLSAGNSSTLGNDFLFADQFCPTPLVLTEACINLAVQALSSKGGTVFLRSGKWTINAPINITLSNVRIVGSSYGSVFLETSSALGNQNAINAVNVQEVSVDSITITAATQRTSGVGIFLSNCTSCRIDNFIIINQYDGIRLWSSRVISAIAGQILGSKNAAIYVDGTPGLPASGGDYVFDTLVINQVGGDDTTQGYAGINLKTVAGVWIRNCDIIRSGSALLIDPPSGYRVRGLYVLNTAFDTSIEGIHIKPYDSGGAGDIHIVASWTSSNRDNGILFEGNGLGADGVRIFGHRAYNNIGTGILINKGVNVTVSESDATGNGRDYPLVLANGISVGYGVSDFSITNNRSGQQAGHGNTQNYGIGLNGGHVNYIVTNNNVRYNKASGIYQGSGSSNGIVNTNMQ